MRAAGCSRVLKEVLLMLMMHAGWRSKSQQCFGKLGRCCTLKMRAGGCSRVLQEVLLMLMMLAGWRL